MFSCFTAWGTIENDRRVFNDHRNLPFSEFPKELVGFGRRTCDAWTASRQPQSKLQAEFWISGSCLEFSEFWITRGFGLGLSFPKDLDGRGSASWRGFLGDAVGSYCLLQQ